MDNGECSQTMKAPTCRATVARPAAQQIPLRMLRMIHRSCLGGEVLSRIAGEVCSVPHHHLSYDKF